MQRRTYQQYCGVAHSLDLVGERWTLLIVRDLLLGPLRYSELLHGLPGITTNLLAKRLREMEALELVERIRSGPGEGFLYRLTPLGAGLEPAVHALARWGWQTMGSAKRADHQRFDWLLFSLRDSYRGGETLRAELVVDGAAYRVILSDARAEVSRGDSPSPDVRVRGTARAVARLLLEAAPHARIPSDIEVEGSTQALRKLLGAFSTKDLPVAAALNRR